MALWPSGGGGQAVTNGGTAATSISTSVVASATPHTMGAWTTLIAATPFAVDGFTLGILGLTFSSGVDTSMLIDIGVGAAASELVVVGGVPVGWGPAGPRTVYLPVRIAAGVRIAARVQAAVGSQTCPVGLTLFCGSGWLRPSGAGTVDSYGVTSASSSGTAVNDPASLNTKGTFTQITAGTTRRHRFLIPLPTVGAGNTTVLAGNLLYDVATGAPGSEVVILPNLPVTMATTEEIRQPTLPPFPCDLPAGTRLSARQQKSVSTVSPMSLVLIGIS